MPVKTGVGRVALLAAGVTLAVGGCSSDTADRDRPTGTAASTSKSDEPNRALVRWTGRMCKATEILRTVKTSSAEGIEEITNPPEDALLGIEFTAMGYLRETSSSLDEIAKGLDDVRTSGITAADRLHGSLVKEVERVRPKVAELTGSGLHTSPAGDAVDRAARVGALIASLKMPEPGLPAVVAEDPGLSAAYRIAPECAPPKPLPAAADGTDAGACKDGTCEILVTKRADLRVGGWRLRVSPTQTKVTVRNDDPAGAVGEIMLATGGSGTFGEGDGDELTVKAVAVNKDGAVLKFRSWGRP
ncbi:hypothetical protein GTU99_00575 [Streptomyces sp. PRKS01-65]|nr:hypothetical protein [Streptomyces harenosi]NEY30711.1 hypothetical protein [Streptomyces harenosi]